MSKKTNQYMVTEHGKISTILGRETSLTGTLTFKKPLQIAGEFNGEIISDGFLLISETANVKANIKAHTVVVGGQVTGNVIATVKADNKSYTAQLAMHSLSSGMYIVRIMNAHGATKEIIKVSKY
jgi:hypothetical protein